ncbi:RNA 2'-phosphotransferase [Stenotrophomonas sp. PD6]|uniref:RNA 2'-phosphotransferase n=1 Tax=Stenotrophomonas sp. PD6 TaxID=3368612 RepID=UPI003BA1034D
MDKQLTDISRFLSFVLRHEPQAIGITLDSEGWTGLDALVAAATASGQPLDRSQVEAVVRDNDKKRFTISDDGQRIRAAQGHTAGTVAIQYVPQTPPDVLYHGTASRFLESILAEGLRPGKRHHVHLSTDIGTATSVGQRYGSPVILKIDALQMHRLGAAFFQADNGVWLAEWVAPEFLAPLAE